jgi:hypothetical protein
MLSASQSLSQCGQEIVRMALTPLLLLRGIAALLGALLPASETASEANLFCRIGYSLIISFGEAVAGAGMAHATCPFRSDKNTKSTRETVLVKQRMQPSKSKEIGSKLQ